MNLDERIEYLREKGQTRKRESHWYKKWWGMLLVAVLYFLAIFSVAFVFFIFQIIFSPTFREQYLFLNQPSSTNKQIEDPEIVAMKLKIVEGENSPQIGNPDAEITIVIFSDFACRYCKQASDVIASLSVDRKSVV